MENLIAKNPDIIGGDTAISLLPDDYEGACLLESTSGHTIAVLANRHDAERASCYTISPNGGYGSILIKPAPDISITHPTYELWLNDFL